MKTKNQQKEKCNNPAHKTLKVMCHEFYGCQPSEEKEWINKICPQCCSLTVFENGRVVNFCEKCGTKLNIVGENQCHCPCIGHLEGCEMRMPIIEQAGNTTTEEVHEIIDDVEKNMKKKNKTNDWKKEFRKKFKNVNNVILKENFLEITELFIQQLIQKERELNLKELLSKLPRKFWEDEDHAVGGYISKKDLYDILKNLE